MSDTPPPSVPLSRASPLRAFGSPRAEHPFEGKIDTHRRRRLKDIARALPRMPGVYFFYGIDDRLLYIGKANCLRERVRSYFAETKNKRPRKLRRLLAEIERMEYEECGCELEALLLERRLIAMRRPLLNRQLKRFDVYPYLLLSDEAFPRLTVTRAEPVNDNDEFGTMNDEQNEAPKNSSFSVHSSSLPLETAPRAGEIPGLYLGPFTTPRAAYWTLEAVRNTFPLRSCEGDIKPDTNGSSCFYHEIGRCSGPCVDAISQREYSRLCDDLLQLLKTGNAPQIDALRARMEKLADEWKFEDAAKLREQLLAIEQVVLRLRKLERIRNTNNLAIVQRAKPAPEYSQAQASSVFLVQGGVVRRHIVLRDWETERETVRVAIRETFSAPPPSKPFTAKEELDEMMILDRWLKAHGEELCCAWLNESDRAVSHAWAGNAVRKLRAWARRNLS
jgi:excinuclease UvrABC nuclease subunit